MSLRRWSAAAVDSPAGVLGEVVRGEPVLVVSLSLLTSQPGLIGFDSAGVRRKNGVDDPADDAPPPPPAPPAPAALLVAPPAPEVGWLPKKFLTEPVGLLDRCECAPGLTLAPSSDVVRARAPPNVTAPRARSRMKLYIREGAVGPSTGAPVDESGPADDSARRSTELVEPVRFLRRPSIATCPT